MWEGREFHCVDAQNAKVRCPYAFDFVCGMTRVRLSEEERSCLVGVYTVRSSEK